MKGAMDWTEMRQELPQDVRERLDEKRIRRRLGEALAELRKQAKLTQADIAAEADVPQSNISRTEKSEDMLLSSIGRYMHALGGKAELVLRNADGVEVHIDIDPGPHTLKTGS